MKFESSYFSSREKKFSNTEYNVITKFPKNALIELSNACNHACVFCNNPRMKRKINFLDKNTFLNFIRQASSLGLEEIGLYSTGEPFMIKNLDWFIKTSKENNIKRVYLTSNGALASLEKVKSAYENGLDSIKYSINSSSKNNYKIIHGKDDFLKVLKNINDVFKWKKNNNIKLQMLSSFIYTKRTHKEIKSYKKIFGKYFEEMKIFPAGSQGGRINNIIKKISTDAIVKDKKNLKPCDMLWNRIHLTCEGHLTACCVDYELDLVYADFKNSKEELINIWNNNLMQKLRKKHLDKDLDGSLCNNCLLGVNEKYKKLMDTGFLKNNKKENSILKERTALSSHTI